MPKNRNGQGRSRKLWPNIRYADTLINTPGIIFKHKKLGYTPKVISSSHWIFEYELGQPSEMEIPDIESKHFVDVTLFDIYGNVFQKSVNVSTTAWGRQRMKLEFKGKSQIKTKMTE